jgi:hypothetical protein
MKYLLTAAAAVLILIGGRAIEDRWASEFETVPIRLSDISHTLGDWEGHDLKLGEGQQSWAQLKGYLNRVYVNKATRQQVSVLLVWGRPDPISQHTPDQCYPSAGFQPVTELARKTVDVEPPRPAAEFLTQDFANEGPDTARLRIYWAWNADGRWQAPDDPHEALARHRQYYKYGGEGLFKLYVIREVNPGEVATDADICQEFLRVFLPEFRRHLFPDT